MNKLKIVFMGTPDFAVGCLDFLINSNRDSIVIAMARLFSLIHYLCYNNNLLFSMLNTY